MTNWSDYTGLAMRQIQRAKMVGTAVFLLTSLLMVGWSSLATAETSGAPSLVISQLKITSSNGQFVTLYNAGSTTLDMSKYQLEYFNSYDLTKATSSRLIALTGTLPPHSYYMINDSTMALCYQLTVDSVSLGFSSTAGLVEILSFNQNGPGASVVPGLEDYVGWSKTAASGAQTLPASSSAFLQRQPLDSSGNPVVTAVGAGKWQSVQPDASNPCRLLIVGGSSNGQVASNISGPLLPATEPLATIMTDADSTVQVLSGANNGLMKPLITEILPNPSGSGNDSTDEFVELYNPNATAFDLGGYQLRAGTTTQHSYAFSPGASLPANSFSTFYSNQTGLSFSNSGGQVALLDSSGLVITMSDVYGSAKDGQAWALANGKWYWTTTLTPGSANIIKQPTTVKSSKSGVSSKKSAGSVKGAKTKKAASKSSNVAASFPSSSAPTTPIHARTLALVGCLALLYAAYEYRSDFGNRIYQLRRYIAARRAGWKTLAWRRGNRNAE
jgi:hypothetical protein